MSMVSGTRLAHAMNVTVRPPTWARTLTSTTSRRCAAGCRGSLRSASAIMRPYAEPAVLRQPRERRTAHQATILIGDPRERVVHGRRFRSPLRTGAPGWSFAVNRTGAERNAVRRLTETAPPALAYAASERSSYWPAWTRGVSAYAGAARTSSSQGRVASRIGLAGTRFCRLGTWAPGAVPGCRSPAT